MKKKIFAVTMLLSIIFMNSCGGHDIYQKDWHINNLELADEYFPKYFDAIEDSLKRNYFQYKKEYYEELDEPYTKFYNAKYYITDTIFLKTRFYFDYSFNNKFTYSSSFNFRLFFESQSEEDVLNLSENYINVMEDVTHFCSNNFYDTNGKYKEFYDEIKEEYKKEGYSQDNPPTHSFYKEELTWEEAPPWRYVQLYYENETYGLVMYISDILTDINIWDK